MYYALENYYHKAEMITNYKTQMIQNYVSFQQVINSDSCREL